MSEEMRLKLELDCNSLNAIASAIRHEGKNKEADCLLTVEAHILQLIDSIFPNINNR